MFNCNEKQEKYVKITYFFLYKKVERNKKITYNDNIGIVKNKVRD